MNKNYNLNLFGEIERVQIEPKVKKTDDPLFSVMRQGVTFTSLYQMPIVKKGPDFIPDSIQGFARALSRNNVNTVPHFYIDDIMISRIIKQSQSYMDRLREHVGVIAPDFSLYMDLPLPQIIFNSYMNKLIAAYWQRNGLRVFPNVSWAGSNSFEACAEGWPKQSIIAINSTGIGRDKKCKYLWQEGYEYMVNTLDPVFILRYGAKQENEQKEISKYYDNDNLNSVKYGRKW